MYIMDYFSTI